MSFAKSWLRFPLCVMIVPKFFCLEVTLVEENFTITYGLAWQTGGPWSNCKSILFPSACFFNMLFYCDWFSKIFTFIKFGLKLASIMLFKACLISVRWWRDISLYDVLLVVFGKSRVAKRPLQGGLKCCASLTVSAMRYYTTLPT